MLLAYEDTAVWYSETAMTSTHQFVFAKVACGEYHTLALSQTGNLYGWGWNEGGELLQVPSEASAATKLELGGRM